MSAKAEFIIKVLSESDWRDYRSIRLQSLQDSPDSFASTYELETSFTQEQWKSRLRISPAIHDALAIAAIADQSFIGLLSCVIHAQRDTCAHIYQMWVSPEYRNSGVGTALLNRIKSWSVGRGLDTLLLSVTITNKEAVSLYQSSGFYPVGSTEPLREGSRLKTQTMEAKLAANAI